MPDFVLPLVSGVVGLVLGALAVFVLARSSAISSLSKIKQDAERIGREAGEEAEKTRRAAELDRPSVRSLVRAGSVAACVSRRISGLCHARWGTGDRRTRRTFRLAQSALGRAAHRHSFRLGKSTPRLGLFVVLQPKLFGVLRKKVFFLLKTSR